MPHRDSVPPNRNVVRDATALAALVPRATLAEALGVDCETTALSPFDGRLRLLTIALPGETYVIDCFAVPDLSPLAHLFAEPHPIKVLHNAKFDMRWLAWHHGLRLHGVFDTMLASQLLDGQADGHSLAVVAQRHLHRALDKSQQKSNWAGELTDAQLRYAAEDAEVLLPLRAALRPLLIESGMGKIAALEFGVAAVVAEMENAGVLLDVPAWKAILADIQAEHDKLTAELQHDFAGTRSQLALIPEVAPSLNLNSTQQVRAALAHLGIEVSDTNEHTLQPLATRHAIVAKLLHHRGTQKSLSAYGDGLLAHVHPTTGRIHANFSQLITSTGRFSCSHPNLQNIPADPTFRRCFIAPPGYKLVVADYSQIELRILAEVSGDEAFRQAFETSRDLHKVTASEMFWVPFDEVTKEQRNAAKSINFGLVYGRGATSLAAQLGVDLERAKELITRYFATYKGVAEWLTDTARIAVRARELRSIGGRRIIFQFDEHDRAQVAGVERAGKNFPIQATNSDILKQAMVALPVVLTPLGAQLVNCVHDELVVEAPMDEAEEVASALRTTMELAAAKYLRLTPVVVEVTVGDSWLK